MRAGDDVSAVRIDLSACEGEGDECYVHGDACKAERATEAYITVSGDIYEKAKGQGITLSVVQWVLTQALLHPSLSACIPRDTPADLRPEGAPS